MRSSDLESFAWHRGLFASTFPEEAGRLRNRLPDGTWERVYFGVGIGTDLTRTTVSLRGTHPRRIASRMSKACEEFSQAVGAARTADQIELETVTFAVARLYAKLLAIHPFSDGNLRAAFVALQASLLILDLPMVEFAGYDRHQDAVASALRTDGKQSYSPLGALLARIIEEG